MNNKYDKNNKIDKGFVWSYWKLSYRRKFIRTLWVIPLLIVLIILLITGFNQHSIISIILSVIAILSFPAQLIYNYIRWKRGD